MQDAMSAQQVTTVVTAHAEVGPTARSALNLDLANLTTDFGLKKRLDDPAWEKVTPRVYQSKKYIPHAKKKKPRKKKEVKPFHSFKGDSHNAKASLGREKEQEHDNINMRYKAMVDGMAKAFKEDAEGESVKKPAAKGGK